MDSNNTTLGEKISDLVYSFGGSWKFIFTGMSFIVIWMALNFIPAFAWDKYPFILLNLLLSLVAAFQAPFIMMSQRRCEIKQDIIYRSLFQEIKDLIEGNLAIEQVIVEQNHLLSQELTELKKIVQEIRNEHK